MAQDIAQLLIGGKSDNNSINCQNRSNISKALLHKSIILDNGTLLKRNKFDVKHRLRIKSISFFKKLNSFSKAIKCDTVKDKSDYDSSMILHNNWMNCFKNCQQQGIECSHCNRLGALFVILKSLKSHVIGKVGILLHETHSQIVVYDMDENKSRLISKAGLEIGLILDDSVIALKW